MTMMTFKKVKIRDIAKINPDSVGRDYRHEEIEYVDISSVGCPLHLQRPHRK